MLPELTSSQRSYLTRITKASRSAYQKFRKAFDEWKKATWAEEDALKKVYGRHYTKPPRNRKWVNE